MAPEAPGNLVVLDIAEDSTGYWCRVDRWDPDISTQGRLWVSWHALECEEDWTPAAGGAVCVAAPPSFTARSYSARPTVSAEPWVFSWADVAFGVGLMLVAVMPPGRMFSEPSAGVPWPDEAKPFEGRMAVFWNLPGQGQQTRVRLAWVIAPSRDESLAASCAALNQKTAGHYFSEPPLPDPSEMRRWSRETRPKLREAPPWQREAIEPRPDIGALRDELARLYDRREGLALLAGDAGLDLASIRLSGSIREQWGAVLSEAEKRDKLADLLRLARSEYPDRPLLGAIAEPDNQHFAGGASMDPGGLAPFMPVIVEATKFAFARLGKWLDRSHPEDQVPTLTSHDLDEPASVDVLAATIDRQFASAQAYVIQGLQTQLDIHLRNLTDYQTQAALSGPETRPYVRRAIEQEEAAIVAKSGQLRDLLERTYRRRLVTG